VLGSGGGNFGLLLCVACRMRIVDCCVPHSGVIASGGR
jgi:hypothetical protein